MTIRPMPTTTEQALRPRGAPFEYWFVKLNAGELAFLVDFIVRRRAGMAEIRPSYWVRGRGEVIHDVRDTWDLAGTTIRIGDSLFADGRTRGASGDVRWDIGLGVGDRWLDPGRLGGMLRAFDTQIALCPGTRASGEVEVRGETFRFTAAPAVVAHYWSIRLPDRWLWLSANTEDVDVEALFATQRLWRLPWPRVVLGYAYVAERGSTRYVISPLTGFGRASGSRDNVRVHAWGPRSGTVEIAGRAGAATYNDLGEGIRQTLLADGRVGGHEIRGVMGLETRGWT